MELPRTTDSSIRLLFLYLNLYVITPWYSFVDNSFYKPWLCKTYGCGLILIRVVCTGISFHKNLTSDGLAAKFLLTQRIIHHFTKATTCAVMVSIIITSMKDFDKWKLLFGNCQSINDNLQTKKKLSMINPRIDFFVKQILFGIFTMYSLYGWYVCYGSTFWHSIVFSDRNALYYEFLWVYFLKCVVELLGNGYRSLNATLVDVKINLTEDLARKVCQNYRLLAETIELFNSMFGNQLILIIFHSGLHTINSLNVCLLYTKLQHSFSFFYHVVIGCLCLVVLVLVNIVNRVDDEIDNYHFSTISSH